jgi:hypothetical protein
MRLAALGIILYALGNTLAFQYPEDRGVDSIVQQDKGTAWLKTPRFKQTSIKPTLMRRQSSLDQCDTNADCHQPGSRCDKTLLFYDRPTNHFLGECMPPKLSDGSYSCNKKNFPKCPNGRKCEALQDDDPLKIADGDGKCMLYGRATQPGGCMFDKNGHITACP